MIDPQASGSPPPPPPAAPPARPGNPWDRRAQVGYGQALIDTVVGFVKAPEASYDATRLKGDLAGPLIFAIVLGWIAVVINQVWQALFGASILSMIPASYSDQFDVSLFSAGGFVFSVMLAPIWILIGLFLFSGIIHLCLMVVGGLESSQSGFEGTFRTLAFASVAQLANVIPIAGGMISFIWAIVLYVFGLSSLHGTSRGRALVAVLIPIVLCCVCFGVAVLMFGAGLAAMIAGSQ